MLPDADVPEVQKMEALSAALKKITEVTVHALALSIATIKTPSAFVSEVEYIEDFLNNCDRTVFNQIRAKIIELKTQAEMQPFEVQCTNESCLKSYMQSITLDMASFFEPAS
jgi:stress-induced morphogen